MHNLALYHFGAASGSASRPGPVSTTAAGSPLPVREYQSRRFPITSFAVWSSDHQYTPLRLRGAISLPAADLSEAAAAANRAAQRERLSLLEAQNMWWKAEGCGRWFETKDARGDVFLDGGGDARTRGFNTGSLARRLTIRRHCFQVRTDVEDNESSKHCFANEQLNNGLPSLTT